MFFCTVGIFLMIFGFISFSLHKSQHQEKKQWQSYLKRESSSNLTLPQDISQLDYIDLSGVSLPFSLFADEELNTLEQQVLDLRNEKILNLNGISNTDLKLQYGVSNLGALSRYDQNFILLIRTLNQWGQRLYELSHLKEAETVLHFAISIGSDIKATYELLTQIYCETNNTAGIPELKSYAQKLSSLRRDSILNLLEKALAPDTQTE